MASSYNGWPASSDPNAIGIDKNFSVCGTKPFGNGGYAGGMKSGDVSTVFKYLITRLHNEVEPMMTEGGPVGYGCWGYSYRANVNNPSQLSCHASGTAIDYNAPKHPNGTSTGPNGGGGWSGSQYNKIKSILGEIGVISWLTSNDPMHFEIKGNASQVAEAARRLGGSTPEPTPEPEPEEEDMSPAVVIKDADTGWEYGIAPGWFQALSRKDEHGIDQIQTGIDAGLFRKDILTLNWVQIMSMRDVLNASPADGIYTGNDSAGNPTFR